VKQKHKRIINRVAITYPIFAMILLPWTLYLGLSLPSRHISVHWDVSWVGLNIALIISFAVTGYLSYRQSRWVAISASVLGSILILDAWFDILTQHSPSELRTAVLMAVFIEIPLALTSFVIAGRAVNHNESRNRPINPYIKSRRKKAASKR
jgi:hypothetical protein